MPLGIKPKSLWLKWNILTMNINLCNTCLLSEMQEYFYDRRFTLMYAFYMLHLDWNKEQIV